MTNPKPLSVSQEMIEAGQGAWLDKRGFSDADVLTAIYLAMKAAEQPSEAQSLISTSEGGVMKGRLCLADDEVGLVALALERERQKVRSENNAALAADGLWPDHYKHPTDEQYARAALSAMNVDGMREALEPFATIGNHCAFEPDETVLYTHQGVMGDYPLTIGDFRKARTALEIPVKGMGE